MENSTEKKEAMIGLALVTSMILEATVETNKAVDEFKAVDSGKVCAFIENYYNFMMDVLPHVIHWKDVLGHDSSCEQEMLKKIKEYLKGYHDGMSDMVGKYTFEEILKQTGVKTDIGIDGEDM